MSDLISKWFGTIYDRWFNIFNPDFQTPVFQYFIDSGFYIRIGLIFIFVPLIFMSLFYFIFKYPYARWWHWALCYLIASLIVFGWTFGYATQFIIASNAQDMIYCLQVKECNDYVQGLPLEYAKANVILSLIVGFIGSMVLKQFSKVQAHLPF